MLRPFSAPNSFRTMLQRERSTCERVNAQIGSGNGHIIAGDWGYCRFISSHSRLLIFYEFNSSSVFNQERSEQCKKNEAVSKMWNELKISTLCVPLYHLRSVCFLCVCIFSKMQFCITDGCKLLRCSHSSSSSSCMKFFFFARTNEPSPKHCISLLDCIRTRLNASACICSISWCLEHTTTREWEQKREILKTEEILQKTLKWLWKLKFPRTLFFSFFTTSSTQPSILHVLPKNGESSHVTVMGERPTTHILIYAQRVYSAKKEFSHVSEWEWWNKRDVEEWNREKKIGSRCLLHRGKYSLQNKNNKNMWRELAREKRVRELRNPKWMQHRLILTAAVARIKVRSAYVAKI